MRSNKALTSVITSSLLLSVATGCSLIKVNGKPLGGGNPNPTSSSSSSSDKWESTEEVNARQQREFDEHERKEQIARGKRPAWCNEFSISESGDVDLAQFKDVMDPKEDLLLSADAFGQVMCSSRGRNLEQRPKVMELRAAWMKLHGLDEQDFEVAVGLRNHQSWGGQDWETLGPAVAQMKTAKALMLDQLGTRASMLGRFSWVLDCLGGEQQDNRGHALGKILCVAEPLDVAKADAEIDAAPKINLESRFNFRQLVRHVAKEQARYKSLLAALEKEEPAVTKLIAIAEQERREWTQPSAARAKLIALVEKMEDATDANKRSAFDGCVAPTYAAWAEVVRGREIPTVSASYTLSTMQTAVFTTAEAYLAYQALSLCMAGSSPDGQVRGDIGSSVVRRNWRTSTIAAWFAASAQIKFDSRNLDLGMVIGDSGRDSNASAETATAGTIVKLTPSGTHVLVEFQKVIEEYEDCVAWKPTNRIDKIDSRGQIFYVQVCLKNGMVKNDRTPDDVTIDATFAGGLKPGMRLLMDGHAPIVATAGPKSSKAVWLFGVSLK